MTGRQAWSGPGRQADGHLGHALSALLDGELTARAAEAAHAHLAACRACSDELAAVGEARSWLRALPPVEPPGDFYGRLAAGGDPGGLSLPRRRAGVALLAASAAAALALLGLVPPHEPATAPSVPRLVEAHATAVGTGDPVSQLVSAGVPVSFGR